ncbi:MAG: hypothetical protein OXC30_05660 [Alphaproteobacteria bacterium]|nr:hypothetical protein [Alphaproteobacteria bacterium]
MTLILLFFTCLYVYGASFDDTVEKDQEIWWLDTQKLIDSKRSALEACFHAGTGGQTYRDESNVEKLQQFVKPIIDILQEIRREGVESQSLPDGGLDILQMASECAEVSNVFNQTNKDHQLYQYRFFFKKFLLCVDNCCQKKKSKATNAYDHFMTIYEAHDLKISSAIRRRE